MLLTIKRLDGQPVNIDSSIIFRLRPGIASMEPGAVSVIHYDRNPHDQSYETLSSKEAMSVVLQTLKSALPMASFTSPSGTPVHVDAAKVVAIEPASKELHFKSAKAVLHLMGQTQQVRETVAKSKAIIELARKNGAPSP